MGIMLNGTGIEKARVSIETAPTGRFILPLMFVFCSHKPLRLRAFPMHRWWFAGL